MTDFAAMTNEQLAQRMPPELVTRFRKFNATDEAFRSAMISYLESNIVIDWVLEEMMRSERPEETWQAFLQLFRIAAPSELWDLLPQPDLRGDIAGARAWLSEELAVLGPVRGLYLGLDTLNMDDGEGTNVEIGGMFDCDPSIDSTEWIFEGTEQMKYGEDHLVRGLIGMQRVYEQERFAQEKPKLGDCVSWFANYHLFLAYTGLVLGHALRELAVEHPLLVCWGFHDGDLFALGRSTAKGFEFICTCC